MMYSSGRMHSSQLTTPQMPERDVKSRTAQDELATVAQNLVKSAVEYIAANPKDYSGHLQKLADLKLSLVQKSAEVATGKPAIAYGREDFLWELAQELPPFDTSSLYQKRASLWAILAAVLLGWICGGLAGTLLNLVGLGGEIFRPLCIFLFIGAEEYLCVNPRARRMVLTVLGFAGLARFATMAINGFFRFTSFGALRSAIFGPALRPGFFRMAWMFFGAFLVMTFLARRISGLDVKAFAESMISQAQDRLKLCILVLSTLQNREERLFACQQELNASGKSKNICSAECGLAAAVIEVFPTLTTDQQALLKSRLAAQGFAIPEASQNEDRLIWDEAKYGELYVPIGLIRNGDPCLVLRQPVRTPEGIIKGHVQKAAVTHKII